MHVVWTCDKKIKDGRHEGILFLITVYLLRVSTHELVVILATPQERKKKEKKEK